MTLVVDLATGIIEYVSDDVARLGWSPAELEGQHASVFVEENEGRDERFQAIRDGKHVGTVSRLIHKDGRRSLYNFWAQSGDNGRVICATGRPLAQSESGLSERKQVLSSRLLEGEGGGGIETASSMYAEMANGDFDTLAKRVRWARLSAGLTVPETNARIGISSTSTTIRRIESGKVMQPHTDTVVRLAKAFNVDAGWLDTGQGTPWRSR